MFVVCCTQRSSRALSAKNHNMVMKINDFEAWIAVDDTPLQQYDIKMDTTSNSATCWIPSEVDKEFSIDWRKLVPETVCGGYVYLDGEYTACHILQETGLQSSSIRRVTISPTHYKPMVFSALDSTDDDLYLYSDSSRQLGEIRLEIWSVEIGEELIVTDVFPGVGKGKIHERSKKAIAHQIKLGDEQLFQEPPIGVETTRVAHLATFVFKYRSIDLLRANGIVPPEPRAEGKRKANAVESDEEDADAKELKALRKKISEIESRQAKKKSSSKKVKTES